MVAIEDGVTIYKYGKEILIYGVVALVVMGGCYLSYKSIRRLQSERDTAVFNLNEAKIKNADLTGQIHQAGNAPPLDQEALKKTLSADLQEQLDKSKQQILLAVKEQIRISGAGQGTGQVDTSGKIYSFPAVGKTDPLMSYIHVDATKPQAPQFDYKLNPLSVSIEGTLNYTAGPDGVSKFWLHPTVANGSGLQVSIPDANLQPSREFNAYLESISTGKSVDVAVPAKWTGGLMVGREVAKEFPGGIRTVYGLQVTRNWKTGIGATAGALGSTGFIGVTYSWGK